MARKIRVGLVGVTGYTGMELARILVNHPGMELVRATSRSEAGQQLQVLYPFLRGTALGGLTLTEPDPADLAAACELCFLAVPHKAAMETADALLAAGLKVVDLSADFRLRDKAVYEAWYQTPHTRAALLDEAVYGLIELYAQDVRRARLVANPGCYPTASILGLAPALAAGLVETSGIVIDAKSGASGAGRKPSVSTLFCEIQDTFRAYGLPTHRHTPEIEQEASVLAKTGITVSFNTHILPIDRGILATIYTQLKPGVAPEAVRAAYEDFCKDKPWVRLFPAGTLPETRWVRGTMYCDLGLVVDPRTDRLIILSAIDNLCRGASGQAVANANLMLGLPVDTGLDLAPMMP